MALIIPNIGLSALLSPSTNQMLAGFSKMESIVLDIDSKLTEVYAGPGGYSVVNIMADRKPKVTAKGPELPLTAAGPLLGASTTVASSGSPVQIPIVEEYMVSAAGTVTLNFPVSATVTYVSVLGALDGKQYTGVASAPTAGQFTNPSAGATTLTFNASDANKPVYVSFSTDSTTGGSISITPTAMPGTYKWVSNAKVINTEDPNKALVPITFTVFACQFIGNWQMSQERQKASATSLDLSILDPGGGQPAIQIVTAAKFAG